ncbi:Hypothetical protein A7982_03058 [Minicystis rosea]|nr:Hypothetical protein A7982_03058 [Minicystis rosea]
MWAMPFAPRVAAFRARGHVKGARVRGAAPRLPRVSSLV